MPTSTPSPHRFITRGPSTQKPQSQSQSRLRHCLTAQERKFALAETPELNTGHGIPRITPAKRFVIASPRTSTSSNRKARAEDAETDAHKNEPKAIPARTKPGQKLAKIESIEGSSQNNNNHADAEMLFIPPPSKRRRLSPAPSPSSSPPRPSTSHRFLVPAPRTPAPFAHSRSSSAQSLATHASAPPSTRPHFLLPPQHTSPPRPSHPLPEHFSPSRKGHKYVPGGLASTMNTWVVDAGNAGYAAQNKESAGLGQGREGGVRLKMKVALVEARGVEGARDGEVDCFPGGVTFVRGETDVGLYNSSRVPGVDAGEGDVRVLLAGTGGTRGNAGVKVREGSMVGIRAPVWDVDVQGEKWIVGVYWVVL
ncbi:hypothetical protein EJ04DRAFT_502634 [Polyplosphaeria fusca]|uniref:Uncharacterized protein n=1 Tax=Polyplosphaeria fusca TaxID=682080 RepID=A0A9P4QMK5_9PLEO|nr:hypothetical protein EJ04DRAFT_502634 [Polyplosphaeria fusca]